MVVDTQSEQQLVSIFANSPGSNLTSSGSMAYQMILVRNVSNKHELEVKL